MFPFRFIFWLTLVIALIPVNPEDLGEGQRAVSTSETFGAATALVRDVAGFCERNPQTCDTGRELFAQLGAKALTGTRHVYAFLDERFGQDAPSDIAGEGTTKDAITTGSLPLDR